MAARVSGASSLEGGDLGDSMIKDGREASKSDDGWTLVASCSRRKVPTTNVHKVPYPPRGGTCSTIDGKAVPWRFASGSKATSWKDICIHGRILEYNCKLSYVKPSINSVGSIYAKINRSELDETIARWSNTLVGYVLGDKPYYMHLKASVTRM